MAFRIGCLKALQLGVAIGLLVLFQLIYPGTPLVAAFAVGYVIAAALAAQDRLVAIWIAFAFSVLTLPFAAWGVYRYLDNGFRYLAGNFAGRAGIHWPAYLFLFVAAGAASVVVLHLLSWRWMLRPRERQVA